MNRCRDCHAIMTPNETECLACGAATERRTGADQVSSGFVFLLTILFFISAAITVASLFFDATPPFSRCVVCTVILLVVRSSAQQMTKKEKA